MCRQNHPFGNGYYPNEALGLIIGTAPPYRFCAQPPLLEEGDINYFYGSSDNNLWYILKHILEPNEIRWCRTQRHCREFQRNHRLAFADMLLEFDRVGQEAGDNNLTPILLNFNIYARISRPRSNIRFLYFSSQAAFNLFVTGINQQPIEMIVTPTANPTLSSSHLIEIPARNRTLTVFILMSPSGNGRRNNPSYNEEKQINPNLNYQTFLYAKYLLPFKVLG